MNLQNKVLLIFFYCLSFSLISQTTSSAESLRKVLQPYFVPVAHNYEELNTNKQKIELGRHLFYDTRLSKNKSISCNSCHDLKKYGTNGSYFLKTKASEKWFRDVPSLYNVGSLEMFNAEGGLTSLNAKIKHAFTNPYEMDIQDENLIISLLESNDLYKTLFKEVYPNDQGNITYDQIIEVLSLFIKGLKTPAPIDAFLDGDDNALSKIQIEGGHVFNSKSCYSCHTGSNFGGQMIQKLGIAEEWPNQEDLGYYRVKKMSAYKMFFRVAPLRNVSQTAPYFHDASTKKLESAIKLMGRHERGLEISDDDITKIISFLNSLTGEISEDYIKNPFN